jgi:hypothetical protein
MEKPPHEHQKVLQDLDRLLNEATDDASRNEIRRLRDSLNTPEMIEMARAAEQHKERRSSNPVLEFHDPMVFTALSLTRTFSVRFDTEGMASRTSGNRWRKLCVGTMPWKQIRALHERREDGVLEVRAAGGQIFEIPMRVANYAILRHHLDNMVMLYGEVDARP